MLASGRVLQRLETVRVGVEQLHRVLGEVAHLDPAPTVTLPASGVGAPAIILSSVDLPAPFSPITAQRSLAPDERSRPSWTTRAP